MGFQMEEILEQIKVRLDPQESLAEMNKDRNMKNRIRGQVMHLNTPNDEEDLGRNQKWENRGLEEHEDEKQQIHPPPHEEKTPHQISSNGSHFGVEEGAPLQDQIDGNRYTYSISTHGFPRHPRQLHPPSHSQQISWETWEQGKDDPLSLHSRGLAVASFSWHSEAREDEPEVTEQIKTESVLNLGLLEELNKQSQWQLQ
jgi:hypothetical protein